MPAKYKNKHGEDVVQQVTYLKAPVKEEFASKCKLNNTKPSSVLRNFILEYINK